MLSKNIRINKTVTFTIEGEGGHLDLLWFPIIQLCVFTRGLLTDLWSSFVRLAEYSQHTGLGHLAISNLKTLIKNFYCAYKAKQMMSLRQETKVNQYIPTEKGKSLKYKLYFCLVYNYIKEFLNYIYNPIKIHFLAITLYSVHELGVFHRRCLDQT